MTDTLDKLRSILEEQLGVNKQDIEAGSNISEDLGADSLDCVEICMAVEEEWDLDIPDSQFEKLITVQDWVNYIENNAE